MLPLGSSSQICLTDWALVCWLESAVVTGRRGRRAGGGAAPCTSPRESSPARTRRSPSRASRSTSGGAGPRPRGRVWPHRGASQPADQGGPANVVYVVTDGRQRARGRSGRSGGGLRQAGARGRALMVAAGDRQRVEQRHLAAGRAALSWRLWWCLSSRAALPARRPRAPAPASSRPAAPGWRRRCYSAR